VQNGEVEPSESPVLEELGAVPFLPEQRDEIPVELPAGFQAYSDNIPEAF
jgi:hypothetical protein